MEKPCIHNTYKVNIRIEERKILSLFSELPENLDLLPTKILILFQQIYTLYNRVIKQREYRAIKRAIELRSNKKKQQKS